MAAVNGGWTGSARVPRFRRLFGHGPTHALVWTPFGNERRGHWKFHLSESVWEKLERSDQTCVALRPRGLPVLFVQWQQLEAKIGDREPRRQVLTVSRDEPTLVKVAGHRIPAETSPPMRTPPSS